MNQKFTEWVIEQIVGLPPEQKKRVLEQVKFNSVAALDYFSENLLDWVSQFLLEQDEMTIIVGNIEDAPVLLEACRKHFAAELDALE